ncbi:hypothetical protein DFR30_2610 [Thiogranum longum]|uniref:Uncharacterized protein n=1 Tax=Thiogranum longum TaxID=1537524 RepID=A0A4R1HGA5_9GAMM|nr:YeeE/YedE family protein [Thiogranum longum]TCK19300.1 hypothetical protein DFR30_2610 [Thiogranum longum]
MENFTPVASLVGGILIGLAGAAMLYFNAKIAGISGIFGGLLQTKKNDTLWRVLFVAGLLSGGIVIDLFHPAALDFSVDRSMPAVIVAGLLVGFGARLGNGCTSGHGVCGIGRLAPRSIVAAATFIVTGAITAIVVNHYFGGSI